MHTGPTHTVSNCSNKAPTSEISFWRAFSTQKPHRTPSAGNGPRFSAKMPGNCRTQQLERLQATAGICGNLREAAGDCGRPPRARNYPNLPLARPSAGNPRPQFLLCGRLREAAGDCGRPAGDLRNPQAAKRFHLVRTPKKREKSS